MAPNASMRKDGSLTKAEAPKVNPSLYPFDAPRVVKYFRWTKVSFLLALCVGIRMSVVGVLCFPWAVINFNLLVHSSDEGITFNDKFNLDAFFTPVGANEKDLFRLLASITYTIDIIVCSVAAMMDYCTGNLKTVKLLCTIWLGFIVYTLVIPAWGLARFLKRDQSRCIFYVDLILLPLIILLLVLNIRWLGKLVHIGYITFPRPVKDEATYNKTKQLAIVNKQALQNDPDYKRIFGIKKDTKIEVDAVALAQIEDEKQELGEGEPVSSSTSSVTTMNHHPGHTNYVEEFRQHLDSQTPAVTPTHSLTEYPSQNFTQMPPPPGWPTMDQLQLQLPPGPQPSSSSQLSSLASPQPSPSPYSVTSTSSAMVTDSDPNSNPLHPQPGRKTVMAPHDVVLVPLPPPLPPDSGYNLKDELKEMLEKFAASHQQEPPHHHHHHEAPAPAAAAAGPTVVHIHHKHDKKEKKEKKHKHKSKKKEKRSKSKHHHHHHSK